MSNPFAPQLVCPHCRAENPPHHKLCWLCHAPLTWGQEVVTAELVQKARPLPLADAFFWILTAGCLLVLVLVGIGIAQEDPAMLILYAIVLAPALIATLARSMLSLSRRKSVSGMEVFFTLLLSASVTVLVVVVLFIAVIVAFFAYCLYVCGQGGKF
jgi:hypothetical protein